MLFSAIQLSLNYVEVTKITILACDQQANGCHFHPKTANMVFSVRQCAQYTTGAS